jgi:hypothetical protein
MDLEMLEVQQMQIIEPVEEEEQVLLAHHILVALTVV